MTNHNNEYDQGGYLEPREPQVPSVVRGKEYVIRPEAFLTGEDWNKLREQGAGTE